MSYIEKNIMDGEKVIFTTRQHKISCLGAAVVAFIGLCICLFAVSLGYVWVGGLAAASSLVLSLPKWSKYLSSEYGVTNRRVFFKSGTLSQKSYETSLNKVGVITVDQSLWGRVFGYGTIVVSGFGGKMEGISLIPDPLEFRNMIFEQIGTGKSGSSKKPEPVA